MTQRRFKTMFILATAIAMLGCTQLKQQPSTTISPTPVSSPSGDGTGESPAPFPSASTSPSPTPSPSPTEDTSPPKVTLTSPTATADFTASAVDVVFSVTVGTNRKVTEAKILYDGAVLATFNQNAATYRLDKWNPNLKNSASGDNTPSGFGDHTLSISVKDDKSNEGKAELKFYRPLKLGAWTTAADMPGPISYAQVFSDGAFPAGFMLAWGSPDGSLSPVTEATGTYTFNPAGSGSWTTGTLGGTSIPRAAYGYVVSPVTAGKIYLVGGRKGAQDLPNVDVLTPLSRQANQSAITLKRPRMKPAAAILDNALYVIGGQAGTAGLTSVERVKLDSNGDPTGSFEDLASTATARVGAHAIVVNKTLWLIGGGFKPISVYDPAKNTWSDLTNTSGTILGTPETWMDALMIPAGGRYYFFGGVHEDGTPVTRIYELDPTAMAWRDMGDLPTIQALPDASRPETGMAGYYDAGTFYVMGGVSLPDKTVSNKVFKVPAL